MLSRPMFKNEHLAVLTSAGPISMVRVRDHLNENWTAYTEGLKENEQLRVLILCGVHGGDDGKVGGDANNVEDFTNLAVSIVICVTLSVGDFLGTLTLRLTWTPL